MSDFTDFRKTRRELAAEQLGLQRRIADSQERLEQVNEALSSIDTFLKTFDKLQNNAPVTRATREARDGGSPSIAGILQILQENPNKVHRTSDLMRELRARGVPLNEKNPMSTVSNSLTMMTYRGLIDRLGRGEYMLRKGIDAGVD